MLQKVLSTFDRNLRANIACLLRLAPGRPATTITYHPDGVAVTEAGLTYFIRANGSTEWMVSDVISIPVAGCRHPIAWAKWCVWKFLSSHRLVPPVTLVLFALAGMGFLWLAICPAGANPFAEWALWIFPMMSWGIVLAVNLTLGWLFFASIVEATARPVAKTVIEAIREAKAPALPAGEQPLQLDMGSLIAPDIPVWSISETETAAEFEIRLSDTRKMYGSEKYVVAAPYGIDSMVVCCPAAETDEFQDEILNVRSAIVGHSTNAAKETWDEYLYFLEMAAPAIREYITRDRARKEGGAAALLAQMAGRSAGVIAALLILAMPAFAQSKTVRLTEYLGNRATLIIPKQGEPFEATFQEAPIKRTGDGQKNLLLLLQSGTAFTDADNAGPLLAVYVGNKMLNPQSETPKTRQTAQASAEPVSAIPIEKAKSSKSFLESTDSLALRGYEASIRVGVRKLAMEVYPRWNFIFFLFKFLLLPVLVGFSLLAYYVAKSAFKEMQSSGNIDVLSRPLVFWGYKGRNCVWLCAIFVGIMLILDGFVSDAVNGNSFWEWLVKSAVKMFALYHITIWITPDPPKAKGMSSPAHASHNYQLTEGR